MNHHLYDNQIEILEAMGMDTSWGTRDWIEGFHRDDLHALSMAIWHAQSSCVTWTSRVAGDPFKKDFESYCKELLVEAPTRAVGAAVQVYPSYFTYRPGQDYLTEKILYFFKEHLPERDRLPMLTMRFKGGDRCFYLGHGASQDECVCSIPIFHEFENSTRLKAELLRYIYKICEDCSYYYAGKRKTFYEAMKYVDALFGSEPLH